MAYKENATPYKAECQDVWKRWQALKSERESWMSHWLELAKVFTPRAAQFLENTGTGTKSQNKGEKKHTAIYDNSPMRSVDVMTAGLVAGMTSPARPWFRLETPDAALNRRYAVKQWLYGVQETLRNIYTHSNSYRSFRKIYEELGVFGTGASITVPDYDNVTRNYTLTVGEFAISTNDREAVDTLYRQFDMTVDQLVRRFGYANCSDRVKGMYDQKNLTVWIPVVHAIEPRRERDPFKIDNRNMAFKSCYMECASNSEKFLQVSGFRQFPAIVPRWKTNGHDFYGEAPAMRALGDNKQLQQEQYRKSQAIDFMTLPPLQVPSSLIDAVDKGPGGITIVDSIQQGIKPAWEVQLNLQYLLEDIRDVRQRVRQALFEDMFLMFTSARPGVQPPTAEEIVAQKEEQLLMVGPVLENLHDEMLTPDIELKFQYAMEAGLIPPAPPELHGQPIIVRFVSTLAQAQRLIGLNSLDRMIGVIVNLAQVKPGALDKLDEDAVIDEYSQVLGVNPDLIVAAEKVALIRQQRAQAQQQQQAMEAVPEGAKAVKALGETDGSAVNATLKALASIGGSPA